MWAKKVQFGLIVKNSSGEAGEPDFSLYCDKMQGYTRRYMYNQLQVRPDKSKT